MQVTRFSRISCFALMLALPAAAAGQSAIDPSVAPRAAAMARDGHRAAATDLLGRYLATAPYDAAAWLELGRLYLEANREWHLGGHGAEPGGAVLLDFASAAFDQTLNLPSDSGPLLRSAVEIERAAAFVEKAGWIRLLAEYTLPEGGQGPDYVVEFGRNLVNSCPVGGVLVTGGGLETAAVWSAALGDRVRGDLVLIDLPRWADPRYRESMADALGGSGGADAAATLIEVSAGRPVCLGPGVASPWPAGSPLQPIRVVRVAGPAAPEFAAPIRVTALVSTELSRPGAVSAEVVELYRTAARFNPSLCTGLLLPLGARSREACGR